MRAPGVHGVRMRRDKRIGRVIAALDLAGATATAYQVARAAGLSGDEAHARLETLRSEAVAMVDKVGRTLYRLHDEYRTLH